ncbi:MAG: formylglycine-generating enzyme family protein [Deltaproteobacteria bacterium]|nr:formylglycine-generating enzyme family protein [Deltaproteobacteria bacterium]
MESRKRAWKRPPRAWSVLLCLLGGILLCTGCGHEKAALDTSKYFTGTAFTNSIGMEFLLIPPGTFLMGSPPGEKGRDVNELQHAVTIEKPFFLQTTEVTQEQWKAVMGTVPFYYKHCGPHCPVESVTWYEAVDFVRKLNSMEKTKKYRLPTEAEWEYACRAGTTSPFNTGSCITAAQANFDGNRPYPGCEGGIYMDAPMPAGSFPPNPWGLFDMHGNVWEWCSESRHGVAEESTAPVAGPASKEYRTHRGGSWYNDATHLRSASRTRLYPMYKFRFGGFRVAADTAS